MAAGLSVDTTGEGVVTVRICRPPDNAFSTDMCHDLSELLMQPPGGAHLVVLQGSDGVFCRGREGAADTKGAAAMVDALSQVTQSLRDTSLVTIAKVDGDAAGFGVGLAALCDVALASVRSRFWFPEITHGLAPSLVLSWLPRVVGRRQAFWLSATGAVLGAEQAKQLGLLNVVANSDDLEAVTSSTIETLLRESPQVHADIKRDLRDFEQASIGTASLMAIDRLLISTITGLEEGTEAASR
ncbi:MAG: enoyl-CoA hydratase/isomerase family protein [Candidatus Dormibacteria bacterium]